MEYRPKGKAYRQVKKPRNPIAKFMLEHDDYYKVRVRYKDNKPKKITPKNLEEFIDDEQDT